MSNHVARDDEVDICQNMPILIYDLEESLEMFQCFCFIKREKLCNFDYKVRTMTFIRRVTDS